MLSPSQALQPQSQKHRRLGKNWTQYQASLVDQFNLVSRSVEKTKNKYPISSNPPPLCDPEAKSKTAGRSTQFLNLALPLGTARRGLALQKRIFLQYAKALRAGMQNLCTPSILNYSSQQFSSQATLTRITKTCRVLQFFCACSVLVMYQLISFVLTKEVEMFMSDFHALRNTVVPNSLLSFYERR